MNETPRRIQLNAMTPAEHAIRSAVIEVEKLGADVRLTDAVILLQAARDSVADYVDGVETRRYLIPPSAPAQAVTLVEVSCERSGATTRVPLDDVWLIWSHEHNAWWGPKHGGYFTSVTSAGVYTKDAAEAECGKRYQGRRPDEEARRLVEVLSRFNDWPLTVASALHRFLQPSAGAVSDAQCRQCEGRGYVKVVRRDGGFPIPTSEECLCKLTAGREVPSDA